MTREEIKQEAQEQVNYCTPLHPEDFIHGYIAGAEPRENKIADIKANCDLAIEGRDIKIMELEKENAELKKKCYKKAVKDYCELEKENAKLKSVAEFQQSINMKRHFEIQKLEKENAELKEKINILENCDRLGDTITEAYKEQLAQAKEIIKGLLDLPDLIEDRTSEHTELIGRAEQFLEEEA